MPRGSPAFFTDMPHLSGDDEQRILQCFGVSQLRSGQREVLRCLLAGENALAVLPTGHGKSLCYQAAALLLGGTSVVISPLIALMRDQCMALAARGIPAARFDSSLEEAEREQTLELIRSGELRLLYLAPESLENAALSEALRKAPLQLFVVDEAHCVSEWGHSFRPDYLRLPRWKKRFPFRSTLALTATATMRVQADLQRAFDIPPQNTVVLPPYRENISRSACTTEDRLATLTDFLSREEALPAIVYCRTRKETEQIAAELAERLGTTTACYHAGQPAELRAKLQDDFLHNRTRLLVATIAFGMGIDKPDIRSVVHYSLPSSPEAYLQESGRAGRDGLPATSLVLLHSGDIRDARNRIWAAEPDAEGILRCMRWLLPPAGRAVSLWELSTTCDVAEDVVRRALQQLGDAGAITTEARGSKLYKARPIYPLSTITDGRSKLEKTRLSWLYEHREGAVEDAALAWDCSFAEAMQTLYDAADSGEWKLTFRQQALYLRPLTSTDARAAAAELSLAYAARRDADLERLQTLLDMLCGSACINTALHRYFTDEADAAPCGHCISCLANVPQLPAETEPLPVIPEEEELPSFDRPAQRRRFLLGISSPALMARRLWAHPHYGCCADTSWHNL